MPGKNGKSRFFEPFPVSPIFQRFLPFFDKYSFWWYLNRPIFILVWIKNIKFLWKSDDEENEAIVVQKIQKIWNTESSKNSTEIGKISEPICLLCHAEIENSFQTFGNGFQVCKVWKETISNAQFCGIDLYILNTFLVSDKNKCPNFMSFALTCVWKCTGKSWLPYMWNL